MQLMQFHNNYKVDKSIFIILTISTVLSKQLITYAALSDSGVGDGGVVDSRVEVTNAKNVTLPLLAQMTSTSNATITNADTNGKTMTIPVPAARLPPPPPVKLNKCCRIGEYLNSEQVCVAGTSERWVPLIYLLIRRMPFKPQGANPNFITFEENVRPEVPHHIGTDNYDPTQRCAPEDLELFTGSGNKFVIFSNGSLWIRDRYITVEPSSYCVDRDTALVCFPKQRDKNAESILLKLKKCCGKYGSYDVDSKSCYLEAEHDGSLRLPQNETYQAHFGFPKCIDSSASYAIVGDWHRRHIDNATGQFLLPHVNLTYMDYCVEHLRDEIKANKSDVPTVKVIVCSHHLAPALQPDNIATHFNSNTGTDKLEIAVLNIGIVISIIFLGATLVAGYLMPSVHHVLHWRCQIYYVFCLFIGDILLAYSQLSTSLDLDSVLCFTVASAMHFFFLSAFFWLNTMCFNIWWTFRDFRPSSLERNQELLRLRLYSAYAWGIPLVITVIAAIVDRWPETQLLRPGFGERGCWFSGENLAIFAYFFGPVGILLVVNIILFISTTHQLTCGLWKRDDVKSTTEKTALGKVCLKLVVVMGVTWIADVISSLVGGPHSPWFFTDLINALQGVFIFIVVGCQPQVWSACKRFCCPRSRQEITNTTNGVQHSSSSHGLPSLAVGETTQNTSVMNTTIGGNNGTMNTTLTKIPMETVC